MKQLIDVLHRDWFYHPEFSVFGPSVDHEIRSITFAGNMMWIRKNFASDRGYPKDPFFAKVKDEFVSAQGVSQRLKEISDEEPLPKLA